MVRKSHPGGYLRAVHLLAPTYADETYTSDTATDLRTALEIILQGALNSDLEIINVTFRNGHADIVLQGKYVVAGDAMPCAASLQILLTVFGNRSVQTAAVTFNEDTIGDLCIFRDGDPPIIPTVDDVYTRAAMETYMKENAYVSP